MTRRARDGITLQLAALALLSLPLGERVHAAELDPGSQACQDCHSIPDWEINDPVRLRVAHLSIDPDAYARSSHAAVPCLSCHSWGYDEIPHRGSSEHPIYECVFCHDGDQAVAHLRLPQRKADLRASVHGDTEWGPLDCHTCHDPHTFEPVNDAAGPLVRVERSNAICLECHGPHGDARDRFTREDAAPHHTEFPNYANHLRKVKCVACHTGRAGAAGDTRHEILEAGEALRECEQCHTPRSTILDAIYGPQRIGPMADLDGQTDSAAAVAGNAYVIGSTRSPRLERLSMIGFAATCLAIAVHGLARAFLALRKRRSNDL